MTYTHKECYEDRGTSRAHEENRERERARVWKEPQEMRAGDTQSGGLTVVGCRCVCGCAERQRRRASNARNGTERVGRDGCVSGGSSCVQGVFACVCECE